MHFPFTEFILACLETNDMYEFESLLSMYHKVENFKEKAFLKYFMIQKEEDKVIKIFKTFKMIPCVTHIRWAEKMGMLKLLSFFANAYPELTYSFVDCSSIFHRSYFQLLM
jgi:hypothetical protein